MDMVAVVIPTLNEERYIELCINSLTHQTYPFEKMDIMIVDGRSIDNTRPIVNELRQRFPNVRLIDNPKRIQSAAFNIGVKNSDAPIIIRLDAHATYGEKYIELCREHLLSHCEYGNVGGVCQAMPMSNTIVAEANAILNKSNFGIGGTKFRVGSKAMCVDTVPFGAFRREVIDKIGGMREDMPRAEDNEYNSRIHKNGYKVFLDPEIVSTYYARGSYKGSIFQMYNNGVSIGHLFYVDRSAIGMRHFVPFVFVMSILGGAILSLFYISWRHLLCALMGLYLIVNIIATVVECRKYGIRYLLILPILFFSVHVSYGIGTIVGLLKYKGRVKD